MRKTRPALWEDLNLDDGVQLAMRDKSYIEHRQRLRRVKPSVNIATPRDFPKVQPNRIGTYTNEEYEEITRDNQRLLKRLTAISYKKSRFTNMKKPRKAHSSLNHTKQKQDLQRIDRENRFLVSRIMGSKSTIDQNKINRDWQRHQSIIHNRQIAKQKRKTFRPYRLSPLSSASSSTSTPMNSSRLSCRSSDRLRDEDARSTTESLPPTMPTSLATIVEKNNSNPKSDNLQSFLNESLLQKCNALLNGSEYGYGNNALNLLNRNGKNLIFSSQAMHDSGNDSANEVQEDKEEEEEIPSDWERDEEWLRKETAQLMQKQRQAQPKTISIGLPSL